MKVIKFIKDWMLLFAILGGVLSYIIYVNIPFLDNTHQFALKAVEIIQPILIFGMLFLTFCKVNPRDLRLCRWHLWLLLFQVTLFMGFGLAVISMPHSGLRVVLEGAMICFICPVGTAAPVITKRLGGNPTEITTYTILINIVAAILIPAMIPYVHPQASMSVWKASLLILGKVFPLLLLPLIVAFVLRRYAPKVQQALAGYQALAFYMWVAALMFATIVTTRFIVHSNMPVTVGAWLVAVAFVASVSQFMFGWKIGSIYGDMTTPGESLGQKNTVFAIWLGYTFFTPLTAVAGGFYSIFQNLINSYNLYKHSRELEQETACHNL